MAASKDLQVTVAVRDTLQVRFEETNWENALCETKAYVDMLLSPPISSSMSLQARVSTPSYRCAGIDLLDQVAHSPLAIAPLVVDAEVDLEADGRPLNCGWRLAYEVTCRPDSGSNDPWACSIWARAVGG